MTSYIEWIRGHVGHTKIPLVGACACIEDEQGRLLWQKRQDFGWWGLPGGLIEIGETIEECVVREVFEETGLRVKPTRLVGVYSSPDYDVIYPNGDQAQLVGYCYACRIIGGKLRIANHETLEYEWFTQADAPQSGSLYPDMVHDFYERGESASFDSGGPNAVASGETLARNAEPLFKTIRRSIGQASFIAPSAAGFVQDQVGRVLLMRRSDNGLWGIPGGMQELGERIDQTVITEVFEETGLKVEPFELIDVYSDDDFHITYPNGDQVKFVSNFFRCRIVGGELKADGVESLEVKFFAADEMPPLETHHQRRIDDALARSQTDRAI